MKTKEEINGLLAKHFSHESLSADQEAELQIWIHEHADEYQQLKQWMDMPMEKAVPLPDFDAEKAWNRIEEKLEDKSHKLLLFRQKRVYTYWAIAVSIALLVGIGILYSLKPETKSLQRYANATEDIRHFLLPDSTEIILYPGTKLTYEAGKVREVTMEGKAFFHVKKDRKPFRITVPALSVEVLGTSFLVDAQEKNKAGVFVKNGTVRVTTDRQQTTLTANEQVEVTDGTMKVGQIDNAQSLFGESSTILTFNQTPLAEAIQEIGKQTGIRIELGKGFEQDAITTRLELNDIDNILKELVFICGCKCDTVEKGKHYRLYYE